jgi:hypothetical protein
LKYEFTEITMEYLGKILYRVWDVPLFDLPVEVV